jgi:hypothetical protein
MEERKDCIIGVDTIQHKLNMTGNEQPTSDTVQIAPTQCDNCHNTTDFVVAIYINDGTQWVFCRKCGQPIAPLERLSL